MTHQDVIRDCMAPPTAELPATGPSPNSQPISLSSLFLSLQPALKQVTATGSTSNAPAPKDPVMTVATSPSSSLPKEPPPLIPCVPVATKESGPRQSSQTTKWVFKKPSYNFDLLLSTLSMSLDAASYVTQLVCLAKIVQLLWHSGVVNITDPHVYAAKTLGYDFNMPMFNKPWMDQTREPQCRYEGWDSNSSRSRFLGDDYLSQWQTRVEQVETFIGWDAESMHSSCLCLR